MDNIRFSIFQNPDFIQPIALSITHWFSKSTQHLFWKLLMIFPSIKSNYFINQNRDNLYSLKNFNIKKKGLKNLFRNNMRKTRQTNKKRRLSRIILIMSLIKIKCFKYSHQKAYFLGIPSRNLKVLIFP